MRGVAIASSTKLAADAGADLAEEGGNAVDAAIAAALVSVVTEPGICSLGAGGFVTVWPPDGDPVTVDGYVEMPGRGLPADSFGHGRRDVSIGYGGGVDLIVGHGSVATPGAPAALSLASERFGRLPWREVVEPAYQHARNGFALSFASYKYLVYAHDAVFGWNRESFRALHREDGTLIQPGEIVRIDHLADSLRSIADHGVEEFYRGELARRIAAECRTHRGILTELDLASYVPVERVPLVTDLHGWTVATNPPPALGGAMLVAMMQLMREASPDLRTGPDGGWSADEVRVLARVQEAVLGYRRSHLDENDDLGAGIRFLLDHAVEVELLPLLRAPSTVHTSAVDADGLACSVTLSAGYGSGVMPSGTGIWLNNCLGEIELNRRGYHSLSPGARLVSNMAPTIARRDDGAVLSVGSPGADRITTALLQVLVSHLDLEMPLPRAILHPRLHVEFENGDVRVAHEPGLPVDAVAAELRPFPEISMYFGGVGAARWDPKGGFTVAADPRRGGGTAVGGWPHP